MAERIRMTGPAPKRIRDTSATPPRLSAGVIAAALGAEATASGSRGTSSPITLFAIRVELMGRLQSTGGRPALSGTDLRAKIPLRDAEWKRLEELATAAAAPGLAPTAGQIASVLLSLSLRAAMVPCAAVPEHAS